MFRVLSLLVTLVFGLGAFAVADFTTSGRWSGRTDAEGQGFLAYLRGYPGFVAGQGGGATGLPRELAAMLPRAPEGWTGRPTEAADIDAFLPEDRRSAPADVLAHIQAVAQEAKGRGVETAALTYERDGRTVIFQAVRYPDSTFTDLAALSERVELQTRAARFSGTEFMTVRGLDVQEDLLPDGVRARYFFANVGAQIHLRVLAPERMRDRDLVPFFQTLHVAAMNAAVVDQQAGLGQVPVIVLASALDGDARAAYVADLADRQAAQAADREARHQVDAARLAETQPEPGAGGGFLSSLFGQAEAEAPQEETSAPQVVCDKGTGGSKRCSVAGTSD